MPGVWGRLRALRSAQLLRVAATPFVVDLFVPDPVARFNEILPGTMALRPGCWTRDLRKHG